MLSHLSRRLSITGRDRHCIILRHSILFFGWFMIPSLLILTLLHFHAFSYTSCEQYKKWIYKSQFPSKSIKKKKKSCSLTGLLRSPSVQLSFQIAVLFSSFWPLGPLQSQENAFHGRKTVIAGALACREPMVSGVALPPRTLTVMAGHCFHPTMC